MYIIVDGIDGSGKSTIIGYFIEFAKKDGIKIFNAVDYSKTHKKFPTAKDWKNFDLLACGEPTYAGIGAKIRNVMTKPDSGFSPKQIAEAFAKDRMAHYKKLVIPAARAGKHIIQDRSVSSSFVYQPLTDKALTKKSVANLPGNKLALNFPPDILLITDIKSGEAIKRLKKRFSKKDESIFEKERFLRRLAREYKKIRMEKYFKGKGPSGKKTKIIFFPTGVNSDIMKKNSKKLYASIFSGTY